MQPTRDDIHITSAEWRWVILLSTGLILLAFAPFLWVAFSGVNGTQLQFMGMLNNYIDGGSYLSKMQQGVDGAWLIRFFHSPELNYSPVFINLIYPALGQLARLINISPIALFHVARVVASLVMYLALYHLGATIWPHKLRPRQIFFVLSAVGSGLGWFFGPITGQTSYPDLAIPEIFPFYSSLVNVHFPLTLACLALLASVIIPAFRPGMTDDPGLKNGGLVAAILSLSLSILYPQALVPFGVAVGIYTLIRSYKQRRFATREMRWTMIIGLPALPIAAYYAAVMNYNVAVQEWYRQNVTPTPSMIILALGLGVPLLIALPGIYRAIRRFEQDGDQLVLVWLVITIVLMYFPMNVQRRFGAGLMIPIAYFATRALEGFWFERVSRRWRLRMVAVVLPVMTLSYVLVLISNLQVTIGPFLERDYTAAFTWLKAHTAANDVVLASEDVSVWIPGWVGTHVVYGHPFETLHADEKKQQMLDWYEGKSSADCTGLLSQYSVKYVVFGPQEKALGQTSCLDELQPEFTYGDVTVYAP